MEIKKSPKADLEGKKMLFKEIGLAVVLGLVLACFEWSQRDVQLDLSGMVDDSAAVEEEMVPVTTQEEIKPPPPPPPPKLTEVLNIVDDDTEINDEMELIDSEANEDTEFEIRDVVEVVEEEPEEDNEVFLIVEEMPSFPGGNEKIAEYLSKNIKYPVIAQENGIQGRVFVNFIINQKGEVTNVKVARPFDPNLDKEAVRVVENMPKWNPGKQRGKAVKVSYNLPINFVLH